MLITYKKGTYGPALVLLAACLAPSGAQAARKPLPSAVSQGPCPSPRQERLETFRRTQEQFRDQKRASRKARLDWKRARLVEAVERARDRIQVLCLALMHPAPAQPARNTGRDARSRFLGSTLLYLLAAERLVAGAAADAAADATAAVPPPPTDGQQGSQGGPAGPAAPGDGVSGELPLELTNILMEQLALDEVAQASPMARRALAAQRSMMQNALATAIARPAPVPAAPWAQLLQGAFRTALQDTAQDFMTDILPPDFGPLPGRRGAGPASPGRPEAGPASEEVRQARVRLDTAKKEVVTAIREAKAVGSDIVIAATSLLGYGGFAAAAYGLDIGASVASIFTTSPVSPAAVATGTLSAAANQLFLIAYASDAVAGAVAIHKFREPYMDALLRVADAEEGWIQAYGAYQEALGRPAVPGLSAGGTGQGGPAPSGSAGTPPSAETGMEVPARPSIGTGGAGPATAPAAPPGADPRGQASGAAPSARPFWRDF